MGPTRFWLLVTGHGERDFADKLFRDLMIPDEQGRFGVFQVGRKVEQLSNVTSKKRPLQMAGKPGALPSRDQELGLAARARLIGDDRAFVILLDDLEHARRETAVQVYQRYRGAFDEVLGDLRSRASVHFLVNMLEAYYFAHAEAVNAVMDATLADHDGDVEEIRHPKNDLKMMFQGFDEREHGGRIVGKLSLAHVLSHADRCASLRTLIGWCWDALGRMQTDEYQLKFGRRFVVTADQRPQ